MKHPIIVNLLIACVLAGVAVGIWVPLARSGASETASSSHPTEAEAESPPTEEAPTNTTVGEEEVVRLAATTGRSCEEYDAEVYHAYAAWSAWATHGQPGLHLGGIYFTDFRVQINRAIAATIPHEYPHTYSGGLW